MSDVKGNKALFLHSCSSGSMSREKTILKKKRIARYSETCLQPQHWRGRRRRVVEFRVSLGYIARSCPRKEKKRMYLYLQKHQVCKIGVFYNLSTKKDAGFLLNFQRTLQEVCTEDSRTSTQKSWGHWAGQ